jgi:hypothetical protein
MKKAKEEGTVQLTQEEAEALKYKDLVCCSECIWYDTHSLIPYACAPPLGEKYWDPIKGLVPRTSPFIMRIKNRKGDCSYFQGVK